MLEIQVKLKRPTVMEIIKFVVILRRITVKTLFQKV
jgi:hypothetical protein